MVNSFDVKTQKGTKVLLFCCKEKHFLSAHSAVNHMVALLRCSESIFSLVKLLYFVYLNL